MVKQTALQSGSVLAGSPRSSAGFFLFPPVFEATYLSTCALPHKFGFVFCFLTTDTLRVLKRHVTRTSSFRRSTLPSAAESDLQSSGQKSSRRSATSAQFNNVPTNTPALKAFNITPDKGFLFFCCFFFQFYSFSIFAPLLRGSRIMYIICVYKY